MSFPAAARGLRTVRDLLRFAVTRFGAAELSYGHGTDNAYDEAAYLILHTLHLPLERLEPFLDATLLEEEVASVLSVIERRVTQRIPAPYLTHEAWLRGYRFYVDERVIVPRSHIAELIEGGFTTWFTDDEAVTQTLDLCTGSGCLAVMLASRFPQAQVDAVDVCLDALAVARCNVENYHFSERVHPVQSDLYCALQGRRYQLIVSNPPYVTQAAMEALPAEYLHEPVRALAAGADGLDVVRRIVADSRTHLMPGGILVVEIGSGREAFEHAFPALEPIWLETSAGGDQVFVLEREQLPA
jgi:ribosomal protein L3 glutamine methyltransferase